MCAISVSKALGEAYGPTLEEVGQQIAASGVFYALLRRSSERCCARQKDCTPRSLAFRVVPRVGKVDGGIKHLVRYTQFS
jgi:hypothetical protein